MNEPRVTSSVFDEGYVRGHYGTEYAVTWDNPIRSLDHHLAAMAKNNPRHPDVDFLLEVRAAPVVRLQQAICDQVAHAIAAGVITPADHGCGQADGHSNNERGQR